MTIVARCNGTLLVEDGDRLGVAEQGGGWINVAVFVTGLLTVILLVNGVVMLSIVGLAGAVLVGGSLVLGAALVGLLRLRRRRRAAPPPAPWLVFDRGARAVIDSNGSQLASFDRVTIERAWQAGSSSKALVLRHPGGRIVIARGNPFGDSVDAFEHVLTRGLA